MLALALALAAGPLLAQPAVTAGHEFTLMKAITESSLRVEKGLGPEAGVGFLQAQLARWHGQVLFHQSDSAAVLLPLQGKPGPTVAIALDLSNNRTSSQLEITLRAIDAIQRRSPLPGRVLVVASSKWSDLPAPVVKLMVESDCLLMPIPTAQLTTHECSLQYPISSNRVEVLEVKMLTNPLKLDPRVSLGYSLLGFQSLGFDESDDCELRLERFQAQSVIMTLKSHSNQSRDHFVSQLKQWVTDNAPKGYQIDVVRTQSNTPPPETRDIGVIRRVREVFRNSSDDCALTREAPFEVVPDLATLVPNSGTLNPIQLYVSNQLDSASAAWCEGKCLQTVLRPEK